MRFAKTIREPSNPSNHVLHIGLDQSNVGGSKGHIQGNLYGNKGMKEFYQSARIFLTKSDRHFSLDVQDYQLFADGSQKHTTLWAETKQRVKVPIGKWFALEYYYKEGNLDAL